jgi:hypothetical protein
MSDTFSLSLELILLMNWLLKNNKTKVKEVINDAIKDGLSDELTQIEDYEINLNDEKFLHNTILDFLFYLEDSLVECLEEKTGDNSSGEKLKPTLQKLNPGSIDLQTIWQSMQETKKQMKQQRKNKAIAQNEQKPSSNEIKNRLLTQLLKNWKPKGNEPVN